MENLTFAVVIIACALFWLLVFKFPDMVKDYYAAKAKAAENKLAIEKEKTEQARLNNQTARFNAGSNIS